MPTPISGVSGVNNVAPNTVNFEDLKNFLFSGILGGNGYFKLPINDDGVARELIVQYGITPAVAAEAVLVVDLSVPFSPGGGLVSIATMRRVAAGTVNSSAYSSITSDSQITIVHDGSGTTPPASPIQWIAIGKGNPIL